MLAEEALEAILERQLGAERAEGLTPLRGDECTWSAVADAARMRSLFSPKRAVVVRGADRLKGPEDDFVALLGEPPEDVVVALLATKPDKRRTIWKAIVAKARVVSAEPLKGARLKARVEEEIRRRGLEMQPDAVEELIDRVGQDLRRLVGELEKLQAFAAGRRITAEDVAALMGRGFAKPYYLVGDALGLRQADKALELIDALLEEGEQAPALLGTMHGALRRLRMLRAMKAERASWEEMSGSLGSLHFKLRELLSAAEGWTDAELAAATQALARLDRRVKTGTAGSVALAAGVAEACRPGAGGARRARPGR